MVEVKSNPSIGLHGPKRWFVLGRGKWGKIAPATNWPKGTNLPPKYVPGCIECKYMHLMVSWRCA